MKKFNIKKIIGGKYAAVTAVFAAALVATLTTNGVMAWGPQRTLFTNDKPATYVTFNSITNNTGVGDETNFVRVREAGTGNFVDSVKVEAGKTYEVYIYFHNNAGSEYNLKSTDTRVYAYFPGVIPAKVGDVNGSVKTGATIFARNANPARVWDEATFETEDTVGMMMEYVADSAKIYWDGGAVSENLSEDLFSVQGTKIGYKDLNGEVPGCAEYSGYITYQVRATQAAIMISKEVSKDGTTYSKSVDANIGDTVYYKVTVKNVGSEELTVTSGHDLLAVGLSAHGGAKRKSLRDSSEINLPEFFTARGNALGDLSVGGAGFEINYAAKIDKTAISGDCGENKIVNGAYISYSLTSNTNLGGVVSNHAFVNVKVPCLETPAEMPKTGGDFGELIMTMITAVAGVGLITYVVIGVKLVRQPRPLMFDDETNMKGMGI